MPFLPLAILLPLLLGPLCAWAGRGGTAAARRRAAWLAAALTGAVLALLLSGAGAVLDGQTLLWHQPWMPEIGFNLGLRLDGLGLMFSGLITGIGLLVILYAAYYLGPQDPPGKLYALLMLFMAAMLGVVLADNLLLLVVFWELTSLASFLLVGYWSHRAEARAGARMALAVTGAGGLALLAGVVLLGQMAGTYELSQLLGQRERIQADASYPVALLLILLGCFTKSAQWPFHFWLPEAMAAPTPVSAYLHSATMVKAGIFLLMRLYPVLGGTLLFEVVVAATGLLTMGFAAYVAVFRHDLKGLLAYSTISHLGLIVFLIGLSSPLSAAAAVFHVLNHATFKASLFMTAGIIDHETGTRDMRRLGGLLPLLPWTATLAMVAAAAMAGVPLANGFISKEMFFAEAADLAEAVPGWGLLVPLAATFGGICSVAYSLRFVHDVFFNGPPVDLPKPHPHEPPLFMRLPVVLLVAVCLVVGIQPGAMEPLVRLAAGAVLGAPAPEFHLALWHGVNLPLLMSLVALAGGVAMYFALLRRFDLHLNHPRGWTGRLFFTRALDGLFEGAQRLIARLESGSLQRYLAWLMGSALVLGALPFLGSDGVSAGTRERLPAPLPALVAWVLLIAAGLALLRGHRDRLLAVVLVGVIGLVTALAFVGLSAPDLALTQLSVELVSTVLLLMGLALLPRHTPRESGRARQLRDAVLAGAGGLGIGALAWLLLTRDHASIAWYFLDQALPGGGGSNVVNVILVDFRGYDTFGEITVLAIAAVGVLALLQGFALQRAPVDAEGRPWSFPRPPLMLRLAARLVLPLALAVSLYLFWRGHNLPGGGFIAGLVTAVALVLQYMAQGQARAEKLLGAAGGGRYVRWIALGLAVAGLTGLGALFFGHPFLTSAHGHPSVPVLGELPLATATLFDLGVYVTVVGATLLTLSVLGAASREPRT
ncbi:monovalent cation/H+ antiporter subunit A [Azohydromonas caseinilytica]|uniref:Monovalent cation/H+ antiporter subunit A n=1 Tax=Azohydromonas caseinilytica TaxID=2728836 RepID=A0A848FJ52_9BURK|nr:monovalent cation/H+ antiporter subunit A [Azohydromonas caseinilytica]NML18329.1 monovalent cation/H+ antiporter subunit A [Azohydromonas caseinilytica]